MVMVHSVLLMAWSVLSASTLLSPWGFSVAVTGLLEVVAELLSSSCSPDLGDMGDVFPRQACDVAVSTFMVIVVRAIVGDGLSSIDKALSSVTYHSGSDSGDTNTLSGFGYFPLQLLSPPHQLLFPPVQCGQHKFFIWAMQHGLCKNY